ncbi:MAG: Nramp family divalent metal transporter [Ignavibacteria bacterium]
MTKKNNHGFPSDTKTRTSAEATLSGSSKKGWLPRLMPFLGPAFIASVAYVDPGNFATNIQGGAAFGYTLLWVIVASNLMAMLIQSLSAKLGIATGKNLAEHCRENFPVPVSYSMWIMMEIVAMATDLAEFLGAALGFYLLFGIPLIIGGLLAGIATFLILGLERYGFRPLEAIIASMVSVIAVCYLIETIIDKPQWSNVFYHAVVPQFSGAESIILATGILGATVMPHAIFLHSALMQSRIVVRDPEKLKKLFRFEIMDITIAMSIAGMVNMAILIMAASTFHKEGFTSVGSIEEAHLTLEPLLGKAAGWIFGLSLLASGLSSSAVGAGAGQIMMQGFVKMYIPVWVRRLVTIFPSIIVIAMGFDPTRTLVISQVVLSFGLPFTIIPLVVFTSREKIMGVLVNKKITTITAWIIAGLITALNVFLLFQI